MRGQVSDTRKTLRVIPGMALGVLAMGVLTGGCVTPGGEIDTSMAGATSWVKNLGGGSVVKEDEANLSPAERRLREQSRAFNKTVWQGVLFGAGAGALWGIIRGESGSDILKKAVIGGAVGGLAGAYIGHKQKQFSNKEDQLDSMIVDVRQSNAETKDLIASVRTVIAEDKRRLADVNKRFKKGQATEAEVSSVRQRVSNNQTVVTQATKGAREKHGMFEGAEKQYRQDNPATNTAQLQREIKAFDKQIETLDGLAGSISVA